MSNKLTNAIKFAIEGFKEENGENAALEEGDEFVTVFNDGVLILGLENSELKVKIILGKPHSVDYSLNLLEKKEGQ